MRILCVAALVAIATTSAASAANATNKTQSGHWEWRTSTGYGPRAPAQAPRRVWVSDISQAETCDCAMMKQAPDTCMSTKGNHSG